VTAPGGAEQRTIRRQNDPARSGVRSTHVAARRDGLFELDAQPELMVPFEFEQDITEYTRM
jgi:hypothetical protein